MPRRFLVLLFALLLLGMQQGGHWHALTHFADTLQGPHQVSLAAEPGNDYCTLCALFAGGATAPPVDATTLVQLPARVALVLSALPASTAQAPSFYRSRAPPALC
jgi:hypothetical protein